MSWPTIIQDTDKMRKKNQEHDSQVKYEEKKLKNGQTSLNRFKPKQRLPTIEELQDSSKEDKMKLKGYAKFKEFKETQEAQTLEGLQKGMGNYNTNKEQSFAYGAVGKAKDFKKTSPGRGEGVRNQFGKTEPTGMETPTKETLQTSKTPTFKPGQSVGSVNAGASKQVNDNLINKNKREVKSKYGQGVQTDSGTRDPDNKFIQEREKRNNRLKNRKEIITKDPDRKKPGILGRFFGQDSTMHTNYKAETNKKAKAKTPLLDGKNPLGRVKSIFSESNIGKGIEVAELFGKTGKAEVEKSEASEELKDSKGPHGRGNGSQKGKDCKEDKKILITSGKTETACSGKK